ncbi:ATP-binding protein [Novosphingobium sp. ZN18A2]|uniref:ATP-binding protein n=1 Tax=Novosphingobium sp. ZN18A2 TaxID=3079861 RepID=UPI0030D13507
MRRPVPHWRSFGLIGRLVAILALVAAIDFAANSLLFQRASNFALRTDEARHMAAQLEVSRRLIERSPPAERAGVARELGTDLFELSLSRPANRATPSVELAALRQQMIALEPGLADAALQLRLLSLRDGGDIAGSIVLDDGSVLGFISHDRVSWTLNAQRIAALVAPTLILILFGWILLRATLEPLNRLVRATARVGSTSAEPVEESGPPELRQLIHGFNVMQERIHALLASRTQTLLAIGHDLRTPLARLRLRLDDSRIDTGLRGEMGADLDEMEDLLRSLQAFVDPAGGETAPQRVDLAAMAMTIVDTMSDAGQRATYEGPDHLETMLRPVSIRRALQNLAENAVHYAGSVNVRLGQDGAEAVLTVEDHGPGIPEDRLDDVMQPFVRLDEARSRDTPGMGLGLAIVRRAIRNEGGSFTLANRSEGGLRATICLPIATG